MKEILMIIFAPLDFYEPAGMFTLAHLIGSSSCVAALILLIKRTDHLTWPQIIKITRILAITMTALEVIKISYNFSYGYTWLDAWFPLSYCSLFIYALWLSGYAKGSLKVIGDSFILIGCLLGGASFLLLPTTSLMNYPLWHYLSVYSLIFHSAMIYLSLMYLKHQQITVNKKTIVAFIQYFLVFACVSIFINTTTQSNIMLLREPFNIPLKFVHELKATSQWSYTLLAMSCYLIGPILLSISLTHQRIRIFSLGNEKLSVR